MKPFLILQLRPLQDGDYEYDAFLKYGGLKKEDTHRVEMTGESVPVDINFDDYSGIIVGGGGPCISDKKKKPEVIRFESELSQLVKRAIKEDFPYLGACYGFCFAASCMGASVNKDPKYAENVAAVDITLTEEGEKDPLLKGLPNSFRAFVGHKESCITLPDGAVRLASSKKCPNHMFRMKKNIYGTQFHPELDVENIIVRVDVYKNAGYFAPEDAEKLIKSAKKETITVPMQILKRFVDFYQKD